VIPPADIPIDFQIGLHSRQWGKMLAPSSRKHAAKFKRGLIYWIMQTGIEKGYWIPEGGAMYDPCAGVGCGGIAAADLGLEWYGLEIDGEFIATAEANFNLHRERWAEEEKPWPMIHLGDARTPPEWIMSGQFTSAVFSPPYGSRVDDHGTDKPGYENGESVGNYGLLTAAEGQVGVMRAHQKNAEESGYWANCRAIYRSLFTVLAPNAVVALVVKDYVKDFAVVPVCDQTSILMQEYGFIPLETTYCMLASVDKKTGATKWNKGQFRRMAEEKGVPRIDYELVQWYFRP
jgi:predicted RNA methylase